MKIRAVVGLIIAAGCTIGGAQAPVFAMGLDPLQAQLPGGMVVSPVTKAILADVDGDGDSDVLGLHFYQAAFLVVPSVAGGFQTMGAAYPTAAQPVALVAADVDGDGDRDAVVLCYGPNYTAPQIQTFRNDGTGGFAAAPLVRPLTSLYYALFVVRVNNDADPDLALWDSSGTIAFLAGAAGASYGPEVLLPTTIYNPITFADDDGDGDDDVHYGVVNGGSMLTIRNLGNGTFAAPVTSVTLSPGMTSPSLADVNGDGLLDAVVTGSPIVAGIGYQSRAQVAVGNGAGGFAPAGAVQILANNGTSYSPLLRDFDGDGDRDLVAWNPYGVLPDGVVIASYNGGSGNFGPATVFETPNNLGWGGVEAGDLDGDGRTDVGVFLIGRIIPLMNRGAAGLLGPKTIPLCGSGGFNSANMLRTADLNRDGRPDAVSVIGVSALTSLCVVLDLDAPSPAPAQSIPVGVGIKDLALGDWNRDGVLDLAVASVSPQNGIGLFVANASGTFAPQGFTQLGTPPSAIAAVDENGDGNLDLVVADAQVTVLTGDGTGGLVSPSTTIICAGCPGTDALLMGDLNVDGVLDAVVSHPAPSSHTSVWLGTGGGTFLPVAAPTPMTTGKGAVLQDVTADGIPDFLGSSPGFNAYSCWVGAGNGTFAISGTAANLIVLGNNAYGSDLAGGDVTGDGIPDMVLPTGTVVPCNGTGGFLTPVYHAVPYGQNVALVDVNGDLQTDAVFLQAAKNRLATLQNLTSSTGIGVAFGLGCPGSGGFVPALSAFGLPQPGGTVTIRLDHAVGGSPSASLLVSPVPALIPVGFGCTLLCNPLNLGFIPIPIAGPLVPGAGHTSLTVNLPAVPGPFVTATQAIVFDPASPLSYSASNGMYFVIY